MEQLKTVKLLGVAGRKFGRVFQLAVKSPAEAVRALSALFPEFRAWILSQHELGIAWRVITDSANGLTEDELSAETSSDCIILAPVIQGAGGNSGVVQVIAGVALIAAALIIPFAAVGGGLALGLMGGGLVLSGVATLITPTPTMSPTSGVEAAREADLQSNLFSRNQGTGGQGEVVPLLYGRRRVSGPRVVSFDLRNYPNDRDIDVSGTSGLLGYVNATELT